MSQPHQVPDPSDFATQSRLEAANPITQKGDRPGITEKPIQLPERIGRYRIFSILGKGGFGLVYLGEDEQLGRKVAIKVPHPHLVAEGNGAEAYITEARTVAALEHPHIIPVYDVGSTDSHPCFVVSKYIDGTDLSLRLARGRLPVGETVAMIATVAEALHFAHKRGFVHRDIKPGNILLDLEGRPFVGDFGLALREQDIGKGPRYAGTPTYMSPEQARGEGHRVDGRSDVFSLGVVLYQMLSGRLPFLADSQLELMEVISHQEPKPLRQWDDRIDRELERISAKALAKRISDRYDTAADFGEELRAYLQNASKGAVARVPSASATPKVMGTTPAVLTQMDRQPTPTPTAGLHPATPTPLGGPAPIVPKGLRSFDEDDADFFLELLPGARDREGLPDSLRFWKKRIEETDPEKTFAVGLIYGPSGCGKSSLVKAGLLPRLARRVEALYVEATGEDTEHRLRWLLRKHFPDLPGQLELKGLLTAIRQGQGPPSKHKLLVVFDQFEQWLFSHRGRDTSELVDALRQCDGSRVQAVVMVRDDFWLAVSRFLRDLEVKLVEGQNSALVDLFPLGHAKKVLTAFGRANGDLPEGIGELSAEQRRFVDEAVVGLAQEDKVNSVRLALFSQMMKGRPWAVKTLRQVGGAEGLGAAFLEETFAAQSAPAEHRVHQKAVRSILKALMPPAGTDIKGHMRSREELLAASGYGRTPLAFDDLLELLDRRLRLITPTDPEGDLGESAADRGDAPQPSQPVGVGSPRFYQLTHDYLVPSIREWLRRKQKETAKGRAEFLLEERAALWQEKRLDRFLPTLLETLTLAYHTRSRERTPGQNTMMSRAWRLRGVRVGWVTLGVLVALLFIYEGYGRFEGRRHRDRLLESSLADLPGVLGEIHGFARWTDHLLWAYLAQAEADPVHADPDKVVRARLGLAGRDATQVGPLVERMLGTDPVELVLIRDHLLSESVDLLGQAESLWTLLGDPKASGAKVLRAASILAKICPEDERWKAHAWRIAELLVQQEPFRFLQWTHAFASVANPLLEPLGVFLLDEDRSVADRGQIARVYGDLAKQTSSGFAALERLTNPTAPPLQEIHNIFKIYPQINNQDEREKFVSKQKTMQKDHLAESRRRSSAALALLGMDRPNSLWSMLRFPVDTGDPTTRSYLISRLGSSGVSPELIWERFQREPDASARRALLLALGGFKLDRLSKSQRQLLLPKLKGIYSTDPDAGIHGASRWLLEIWQTPGDEVARLDQTLVTKNGPKPVDDCEWFLNKEGQTFSVIESSGVEELGYDNGSFTVKVARRFAIGAREVTEEEFRRFRKPERKGNPIAEGRGPSRLPIAGITWYDAAAYCNWLSEREGIPRNQWCYRPNSKGEYAEGMTVAIDAPNLSGYRLPTAWEWEWACRAGSKDLFGFGQPEDLLEDYGWFDRNSFGQTHPVGLLRPNDWGLFDTHGNVAEWCQNSFDSNLLKQKTNNIIKEKTLPFNQVDLGPRMVRGGGFQSIWWETKAANDLSTEPSSPLFNGFRLARTITP